MNNKFKILAVAGVIVLLALLGVSCLRSRDEDLLIVPSDSDIRMSVASEEIDESEENVEASAKNNPSENETAHETNHETKQETATHDTVASESATPKTGAEAVSAPEEAVCEVVVHVCGEVSSPGVYTLPGGSRVYQAIEAAGGFTSDAFEDYLNQANELSDGMKVYVPSKEEISDEEFQQSLITSEAQQSVMSSLTDSTSMTTLVNINTATREDLMTLKGIGESKADKIISYRETQGGFGCIEDIMNIPGIKEGMFNKIKDLITVN